MKHLAMLALAACSNSAPGDVDGGADALSCGGAGCQAVELCSTPKGGAIALGATEVYVSTREAGTIVACPKSGGPARTVWGGPNLAFTAGLAADATNVYWTNQGVSGNVSACASASCDSPTVLASMQSYPASIALDDTNVYWQAGFILACAKTGCGDAPTVLASNQGAQTDSHGIVVDDANVYWTNSSGMVMACAKTGCGGMPTALASGSATARSLAVDGTNLYWTNLGTGGVLTCPVSGCSGPPTTLAPSGAGDLAIDGTTVYWTSSDAILACAKTGCNDVPETITTVSHPSSIAVDATGVYWITNLGKVMKLPR